MDENYKGCLPLLSELREALRDWKVTDAVHTRDLDWKGMMDHLFKEWAPTPRIPIKHSTSPPSYLWLQKALAELAQCTTPSRSGRGDSRSTIGAWLLDCAWTELSVRNLTTAPCRDDVEYRVTPNNLFVALTTFYTDPENRPVGKAANWVTNGRQPRLYCFHATTGPASGCSWRISSI